MCGRYALTTAPEALRALFGYAEQPNFPPRYNIAPTQPVPVVRFEKGERQFVLMRWGLVPSWSKEVGGKPLINVRSETVAEKQAFRNAFRRRRCLVPADAFYEWRLTDKQPFMVSRADGAPFALAGIWEHWAGADGSELESVAILTTAAAGALAAIHPRMPLIVDRPDWPLWLDPDEKNAEEAEALLKAGDDDLLTATPVSKRINAVANDGPSVQAPPESEAVGESAGEGEARRSGEQMTLF